jgi:class 3 adenylate cyclase
MAPTPPNPFEQVHAAILALEAQRALLGDAVVETALAGLRKQLATLEAEAAAASAPAEERRLLTILFTDIVGSTALAEQLDPEEWRRTVAAFHAAAGGAITAHGGTIAQYLGDGLLAFFGAEQAGEHDPENAVRAALDLQVAVAALPPVGPQAARLLARAGLHTGLVVVGAVGSEQRAEYTIVGDPVNLASRIEGLTKKLGYPLVVSREVFEELVEREQFTALGEHPVKGRSSVEVYGYSAASSQGETTWEAQSDSGRRQAA